ncbi:efflux RND transporter periplasmic adaptor subunit [Roseinatronobacter bogoriensis]|uniref:Efflux RND transporter periplasmic adaptor subunit n=1 Tax=Roseinatronobacter bogoriensis subsp. barguzinensis TaxID=441209 RepID=A0A2K8K6Z5_9RHOB|nr:MULTISPECIES: efflux RND transporter periplasmic adaptor subunit [Rhodobaca]ATX64686.1 efflux RND transporter periplasmic adaptor subunit [Rhodobaca barguzinensis]MBB4209473.1 multidrug efflux system membrane fusion protein [Rhodobaca bogoriensis DSM 18756]TDW35161.1 multidrug efflux system membrane fusion protein [Rhodobaca barguzinensis]TDY66829.1 multidrug efflux system membrane fusion protein [Rhodobaca bogoriensis DSM 18756]
MRVFPLVTALFVTIVLYLSIMEREALLGFAGVLGDEVQEHTDTDAQEATRVRVLAQRSIAQPVASTVVLRGRTEAQRQVEIRSETSGLVTSDPLRRGASVKAGDRLCEVAPGVRKAALDEAQARLAEAEINFRAASGLSESGFSTDVRLANARAALQAAQAGVDRAVEEMARLVMHAPFDGLLETDTAELGSLLQPGALCATLIQMDPIKLVGFATEAQVDLLETGAPAAARLASGREVMGTVSFIARSADAQTRTFRVDVTIPNPEGSIRDGQSADIIIQAQEQTGHLLPSSALTLNDAGELGLRLVDDDGLVSFAPAQILRDSSDGIWLAGLPDEIGAITVGQEFTREGARVHVTWDDNAQAPQ